MAKSQKALMGKIKGLTRTILLVLVLSLGIRVAVVEPYWIPSRSMVPALREGDRMLGQKLLYWISDPEQGDIVIFTPPPSAHTDAPRLIKRVIGVERDWIEVKGGIVYRNGRALAEPYIKGRPDYTLPPIRVPTGHVFVLGDNRKASHDSHIWGFLPKRNILAKALFRFWPPAGIGLVR